MYYCQTKPRLHDLGIPQLLSWLLGIGVHSSRCRSCWWYGVHLNVESERRPIVSNGIGVYFDLASKKIANFPDQKLAGGLNYPLNAYRETKRPNPEPPNTS